MKTYIKKDVVRKVFKQVQPEILDLKQVAEIVSRSNKETR